MTYTLTPVTNSTMPQANSEGNDSAQFHQLEPEQQAALVDWIRDVLVPAKTVFRRNSYHMKHDFRREPDGFHVNNGAFKGAMLASGFIPVDQGALNWCFRVKLIRKLCNWERRQMGLDSTSCLVRDRSRERGYIVTQKTQWLRNFEHSEDCLRERLPKIVVMGEANWASISLDTAPAGYCMTEEAVLSVRSVFAEFDPHGWYSHVNERQALIRRVPMNRAAGVAAALVSIVTACSS